MTSVEYWRTSHTNASVRIRIFDQWIPISLRCHKWFRHRAFISGFQRNGLSRKHENLVENADFILLFECRTVHCCIRADLIVVHIETKHPSARRFVVNVTASLLCVRLEWARVHRCWPCYVCCVRLTRSYTHTDMCAFLCLSNCLYAQRNGSVCAYARLCVRVAACMCVCVLVAMFCNSFSCH